MKHLSLLLALAALFVLGTAALAEPITEAEDSVPVTVYIAPWVWVDITSQDVFIDVEAGQTGACGTAKFTAGANTHAHLYSSFVGQVPAGVTVTTELANCAPTSGTASVDYWTINEVCLNYASVTAAGTIAGDLLVHVNDVDITDRAGEYSGTAYANIYVW